MAHFSYGEQRLLGRTVSLALKYGQRKNTEHRTVLKILKKLEMLSLVRNRLCVFNWTTVTLLSVLLRSRDGLNRGELSNKMVL